MAYPVDPARDFRQPDQRMGQAGTGQAFETGQAFPHAALQDQVHAVPRHEKPLLVISFARAPSSCGACSPPGAIST